MQFDKIARQMIEALPFSKALSMRLEEIEPGRARLLHWLESNCRCNLQSTSIS